MNQISTVRKKLPIILDTNIIIYQGQLWTEKQLKDELANLERIYKLTISKITRFEILKSTKVKKENKLLKLLNLFESFEITEKVLIIAALLHRLFKDNHDKKIQDSDVIIAATAFLNNSYIFTSNRNDFPYPFFEEEKVTPILYKREIYKTECLLIAVLKPNTKLIKREITKIIASDKN